MAKYIGITGGIGSGKSAVGDYLLSLGYPVIDTDVISREVVQPGSDTLALLANTFGQDILLADGSLNRPEMARRVFTDVQKRKQLNAIMHPAIHRLVKERMAEVAHRPLVFLMVPLLYETGFQRFCNEVWLVQTSRQKQVERLTARDQIDEAFALKKIEAQMSDADRLAYSPKPIDNNGTLAALYRQVDELLAAEKPYDKS